MTGNAAPGEPHRTPEIDEVFRRIGRNLLLFQHIEHLLKQLMTNARLEGTVHSMQANLDERRARIHKQTLGQLAGQFVDRAHIFLAPLLLAFAWLTTPFTWVLNVFVTVLALGLVLSVVRAMASVDSRSTEALGLVSGGALGNLASIVAGPKGVADFLAVRLTDETTMIANVADLFLWAGALALGGPLARAEDEACSTVKLADPGWTDIAVPPTAPPPTPTAPPSRPSRTR